MEMNTLDELERLLAATQSEEWRVSNRDPVRVVDGTGAYIALCDPHHKGDPLQETRAALIVAAINALPGLIESAKENAILKRLAPEYYQWPGKAGAELAPEWLQHRLKYGGASVDGDILAVYDWHDRRSLAAPGDYVVDGEKGLYVLVNARTALKGT
jgi:hypothetical protein